ncbi:Protein of unknown function (DUF3074)-domain containing protein [Rhodotorula toruloides]|uniref:DUF3074 domain-containing protein n=1 Tax=Rhodotorula toruloides TaxID=5286 RepID=A0A2T0AJ85_RHOTO|nr:Protein of unknown function (DUF3074)-domain containing protein [Rhodotorula toruloides]
MASPLRLTPVKLEALPQSSSEPSYQSYVDAAVSAALDLVTSLPSPTSPTSDRWAAGKTFQTGGPAPVHTYSTRSAAQPPPGSGETEGLRWHARKSVHRGESAPSYEAFERGLLRDHSVNEAKYIESCTEARKIKTLYHQAFPASNRDFTFLLLTTPLPPRPSASDSARTLRSFMVISLPVEHPAEKGYVRGRYVSVEHVQKLDEAEGGGIEWVMAVSSSAGGMVPRIISEKVMPSKISEDVPSFIEWVRKQ